MNDRFGIPFVSFDPEGPLAPCTAYSAQTRGRVHVELPLVSRTEFQRGRDRTIHSTAFRRPEYKMQVFVNHKGDPFRIWSTHSLKVAQIARSIVCSLCLNEDSVEAVSLAHDLGHTSFGHVGQNTPSDCMKPYGDFEHSLQSLLVVDRLEERYGGFNGLNLTFEIHGGILKRCSRNNAAAFGDLGRRFLEGQQLSLEAQLTNLADGIAYDNHSIDDGLRSGPITLERLEDVPLWVIHRREAETVSPNASSRRPVNETTRCIINALIVGLIGTTCAGIAKAASQCIDDIRTAPALVMFSTVTHEEARVLKRLLFDNLYRYYLMMCMFARTRRIIDDLLRAFMDDLRLLLPQYQAKANPNKQPCWIMHYIAGMTDCYVIKEHHRILAADAV